MDPLTIILLAAAAICFLMGSIVFPTLRVNLVALGLFFWVLVPLLLEVKK